MNEIYWFFIETYVHILIKKNTLLLYNSLNGKELEYSGDQYKKILNLIKRLQAPKNLNVIRLTGEDLQYPIISEFIQNIRDYFFGDLIDSCYSSGKPIQLLPIVTIGKDVKRLKKYSDSSVGENLMEYLKEIFLYIGNACDQNCRICSQAFRQFNFCTINSSKYTELDIRNIKELLEVVKSTSITNFNILGGNIFTYPKFVDLVGLVNHLSAKKVYFTHYSNLLEENGKLKFLNPNSSLLKILVPSPIDQEKLEAALEVLHKTRLESKFIFIIQSGKEFEKAEAVISSFKIENPDFQPFFNGENLDFFKENVFMSKDDVIGAKPTMKDIYTNSVVNKLNFGRLTILSNGNIYANVNASRLGVLGKDSIYDVLYKEMYHGKSWRRIRKNVQPCKHCTFQTLCPPLSNYTYAISKNNLCHIMPFEEN